jgi:hypothetical protein
MVARPATPYRSANAGEFSPDAKGRVDIKQYYSAGLAFKNTEPVPQSGFRQMGGSWRMGEWRKPLAVRAISAPSTSAGPHTGTQTVWTGTVAGAVAAVLVTGFAISAGTATFDIEAFVGGVWTKIAGPFAVATGTPVTRFAAFAPGQQKVATSLRIRATFSISATVTIGSVAAWEESGTALAPRMIDLTTDAGDAITGIVTEGIADFFTEDGFVGAARLAEVTAAMLPDLGFYAEAATIGIFHADLESRRLLLMSQTELHDWRSDLWPYETLPTADLGGVYAKTDDIWEISLNWGGDPFAVVVQVTINGETTPSVDVPDIDGNSWDPGAAGNHGIADWPQFVADLEAAIQDLPSLSTGVTVADLGGGGEARGFRVTFGGDLSGEEFDLASIVVNTAQASALASHTQIGKTEFEDLFSALRGWPGFVALMQDRMGYGRVPAVPGALALSRIGEYFDLNIEGTTDQAARLDKLRSQTSELIVAMKEATFVLVFTDRGVYFINNRTIERNAPLNFIKASEIGAQPNCEPFDLEGKVFYVAVGPRGMPDRAVGGQQLLSVAESVVSSTTSFEAAPESLLATHLVEHIIRSARQKPENDLDASKGWLMRTDGRLIAGQIIKSQEITGFCEWIAASQGAVREIRVDGRNRLWLAVERAGIRTHELYDPGIFLHDAVEASTDLAGLVTGLAFADGDEVWAVADGYVLGPFVVDASEIDLEDPYDDVIVGRWQAPRFESMPQVYVTPGDDVILRPGRIHTAHVNVIDTTSIAIGANGEAPRDITLAETTDPVDAPTPAKSKLITETGLVGSMTGTTLVITQTRPGTFRVRDYAIGAKL